MRPSDDAVRRNPSPTAGPPSGSITPNAPASRSPYESLESRVRITPAAARAQILSAVAGAVIGAFVGGGMALLAAPHDLWVMPVLIGMTAPGWAAGFWYAAVYVTTGR